MQGLCNKFVATEHVTDEELEEIELVSKLAPTVGEKYRNRDKNCINKQRCRILLGPDNFTFWPNFLRVRECKYEAMQSKN